MNDDGTMARLSGRSTPWGAFLDSTLDRIGDAAVFGGLVLWFSGNGDEPVLADRRRELPHARSEHEAAIRVTGHQAVRLQRDRQPMRSRTGQASGLDERRETGGLRREGIKNQRGLVQHADAGRLSHVSILASQDAKRTFRRAQHREAPGTP